MLNPLFGAAAAVAAIVATAAPASAATVLDFDAARGRNGRTGYVYGPWSEAGYTVSAARCSQPANTCFVTTGTSLTSLDREGAALTNFLGSSTTTLASATGGAFRLVSMDMAGNYGNFSGFGAATLGVTFTYTFLDGSTRSEMRTLDNTPGQRLTINPLTFDARPLRLVSWMPGAGTSGFLQFDNIAVSAVPEPASWALLIIGFGAVGAGMRRRRTVNSIA